MKEAQRGKLFILSMAATVGITAITWYFCVPNPNMVLITAVITFTFVGGFPCGVISAAIVIGYSLLFFSLPGQLFHYSAQNFYKIIVIVAFVPVQVLLVGILKKRADVKSKKLEQANQKLNYLSRIDYLTDIPNRRYFNEMTNTAYQKAQLYAQPICCALIDIDFFKQYNDHYGHIAGDECLKKIAGAVREELRGTNSFAARYGGEEFVILFPNTEAAPARSLCEKVQAAVKRLQIPHADSSVSSHVTISIGVASVQLTENNSKTELLRNADKALYLAKEMGRNRIESIAAE